ncbi:hypothetical protein PSHT_05035 [Puccinia striiformis]|uniref:Uncharacterized protein n=1 Tax=Puccinia striiformis TaxID=27350 RepID=A0A2S4WBI6_9BASI|nr:hypothetical protein PSHT_05035 [Puccinia striiformis]
MKAFSSQPWLLLLHTNTALSSMFAASSSQAKDEALAVKPTLSLEWQEDEIQKYLSEPLYFPQLTLPLGNSKPNFHTQSYSQEREHQPPPSFSFFKVEHTPNAPLPSNVVPTSNEVLSFEGVPTSKSDSTICDLTCSSEITSIRDLSPLDGLAPDGQLTPNHNVFAPKGRGHKSMSKDEPHLLLARKKMKAPQSNKKSILHVDHPENLPKSNQRAQSKRRRRAGVYRTNIKRLVIEILGSLSNAKIQIENYPLFKEIVDSRRLEIEKWTSRASNKANDIRKRDRIHDFLKNVTKMSTFLIISHASLLNGQMDKEITPSEVKNVLEFMKDFWDKMHRKEPLVLLRPYSILPKIPNLVDPNDLRTCGNGLNGKFMWYRACVDIVKYWTEKNMNLFRRSSSDFYRQSDKFNIRKTIDHIIAHKNPRHPSHRNGAA